MSKQCRKCGEEKSAEEFSKRKAAKDGLGTYCKLCCNARNAEWREKNPESNRVSNRESYRKWSLTNKEKKRAKDSEWRGNNTERVRENYRKWRESNLERTIEACKQWRKENPDKAREGIRKWKRDNPETVNEIQARRRARLAGCAINDFKAHQWLELLEEYQHSCAYCGVSGVSLTRDHVVPIAKGGDNTKSNIVPACSWCNSSKNDRELEDFLENSLPARLITLGT